MESGSSCDPGTSEYVVNIVRLCKLFTTKLDTIGNSFISIFSHRKTIYDVGSTILSAFREFSSKNRVCERIILSYLLYRSTDIEFPVDRSKSRPEELIEQIMWHPFLAFFLILMEGTSATNSNVNTGIDFDPSFPLPIMALSEKYFIGCLLMGRVNDFNNSRPIDIATYIPQHYEAFNLIQHKEMVKCRQSSYPLLSTMYLPAIFTLPEENNYLDNADITSSIQSIVDLSNASSVVDALPPPFLRLPPTLMPPCDDEYEILHPMMLEPLWADESAEVPKGSDFDENFNEEKTEFGKMSSDKNLFLCETKKRIGSSLPTIRKSSTSTSLERKLLPYISSVSSLPNLSIASISPEKCVDDVEDCSQLPDINNASCEKKPLLGRMEAVELLKKSQTSVIARTDAQKLADAISNDPSLINIIEIGLDKYQKFIDDNPTVAAAVIVERIKLNKDELPIFFDLLREMNLTVQAMEVVNKLCMQIDFPQEYLNAFISTCVQRCMDPSHSAFIQCRQVRMVCVFLSSLIRNRTWNVQPLSVELQGFVLKFSNVKEAASLYQAILMALQPADEAISSTLEATSV